MSSFTAEDAKFVSQCRMQMILNMQKGLPPEHDIDKDKLKRALETIRKERSLGAAAGGKASHRKAAPTIPLDLEEFMKK